MGFLQTIILEWVAVPSSRGSSQPRDWTQVSYVSCIDRKKKKSLFFFFKQAGSGQNFCSDILLVTFHFLPQRHPLRIAPECSFWCIFSGFPDSSVGKESACNAGGPSLISGLESSPGEGIGYPLQYSWASLVAHMVKNLPTIWETWVRSLGWEDPLKEGTATHSSILAWRISMDRGAWRATVHGVANSWTWMSD